ncbi:MAG: nuclear transport factor 2 family protein [Mucilaginibacter polytrichastri]|nr:nuclear transport factor 2 family protein [Mucilaginibacter polytrichastri]
MKWPVPVIPIIFLLLFSLPIFAQAQSDRADILKTIDRLFTGMRTSDSALVHSAFAANAVLQTVTDAADGSASAGGDRLEDFLLAVAKSKKESWDEKISDPQVHIDGNLAAVWAGYTFLLGGKLHHVGIDSFQLVKERDGWRIVYLIDTQKKSR